ncbi:ATP-dependent Clp protease proteolytic subunit, putative [Babesia ovis]|uniref:ATP-dependent Clp protease proteolytic subunit, putative n=1 Tax=Babesia ovis TaxID=5869 RepID=A0A9W5TDZ4_BABOV|nr:ATP-dependent Clp protease proteolytic subunit, putative [Babesia ovis]
MLWHRTTWAVARFALPVSSRLLRRSHSTQVYPKSKAGKGLLERVDKLSTGTSGDSHSAQQGEVVEIAKSLLHEPLPLDDEALILSKLAHFKVLRESFVAEYIAKLESRLNSVYNLKPGDNASNTGHIDSSDFGIHSLQRISKFLISQNVVSGVIAGLFVKWIKTNGYYLVPNHIVTFNGMLEYVVHAGGGSQLFPGDFDVVTESAGAIEPGVLVDSLYFLAKLGIKNEPMLTVVGRILHNEISRGSLSPYHKTKLVRAYALLKHEHITFFRHIADELRIILEGRDTGKYILADVSKGRDYTEGIGSNYDSKPSGVVSNVMPCLNISIDGSDAVLVEHVPFSGLPHQLYSDGQIIYILDSMYYLGLHHLESFCGKLCSSVVKHCYVASSIGQFDVEQLRSSVSLLALSKIKVDDTVLEAITRRFLQAYVDGQAKNSQLALFLKDFVKQTRQVVKRTSRRGRVMVSASFKGPQWLTKPLSELPGTTGHAQPSMLEVCCTSICENVHSFDLVDLTSCIRSVAYMGFRNENFYMAFVPYFKERIASMNNVAIANLTQAFTKVNIKDDHLFYLMGKQHQLHLQMDDKAHKLILINVLTNGVIDVNIGLGLILLLLSWSTLQLSLVTVEKFLIVFISSLMNELDLSKNVYLKLTLLSSKSINISHNSLEHSLGALTVCIAFANDAVKIGDTQSPKCVA